MKTRKRQREREREKSERRGERRNSIERKKRVEKFTTAKKQLNTHTQKKWIIIKRHER